MALHLKIQEVMAVPRWMTREEQEALHLKNLEEPAALHLKIQEVPGWFQALLCDTLYTLCVLIRQFPALQEHLQLMIPMNVL